MAENQEIKITEDGGIIKKILQVGTGEETPVAGNTVQVTYIGTLEDGTGFDSCTDKENPFEFKVGVGQVIKGWDQGMVTMKKGERAVFTLTSEYAYGASGSPPKIPANATLIFEVEMLNWVMEKGDHPFEVRYVKAQEQKDAGNGFFKQQKFLEAQNAYTDAIEWLETMYDQEQAMINQRVIRNNLAAVLLRLKNYTAAIVQTSKILEVETENEKALFRRGQAYAASNQFDNAKVDLKKAYEKDPKNNAIIKELQTVQQKLKDLKQQEKQAFAGLFKKDMYSDKEDVKESKIIDTPSSPSNPRVFMDIKVGEAEPERVEFELYNNVVPKTAENFKQLCQTKYKNAIFHRNIKNFMIQGGDYENRNGTGGKSIYGEKFNDENFNVLHTKRGQLSMANAGPNTNGSQFFVLYKDTPHLDGKHVVFGEVSKNIEFLDKLENSPTGAQDAPSEQIEIVDCGVVEA